MKARSLCLFLPLFLFLTVTLKAQDQPGFFLDCQMRCDIQYIKQEIRFVNYMFNRQEADIYVLATWQRTGAGGREVQLVFIGNYEFEGMRDTSKYFIDPNATDAIERDQMVQELKKGLLPFILQSSLADEIEYTIHRPEAGSQEEETVDPWNFWVFNIGGNAWLNGEKSFQNTDLSARFSASRVTDAHKLTFWTRYNYDKSSFTLTDGESFSSLIINYNAQLENVWSLSPRWSAGFISRIGSSTFSNTDVSAYLKPAIEFNVYPYSLAQTKRFSFRYSIGPEYYNYTDTTIYNRLSETRMRHQIDIEFEHTQEWGDISFDIGVQQYLHNPKLFNAYFNPNIEWQIFKGFSLDLGGYVSFVSDRINIAKSDITDEDIILQLKQLDTNFTYFSYVGINYRFGSRFNNVVNPRF